MHTFCPKCGNMQGVVHNYAKNLSFLVFRDATPVEKSQEIIEKSQGFVKIILRFVLTRS